MVRDMRSAFLVIPAIFLLIAGCATQAPAPRAVPATLPAAADAGNAKAYLTLDEIQPAPVLVKEPTSRPADPTPSLALQLYARGLDAMWKQNPYEAIEAFRQGLALDPYSFELNDQMGRAQLQRMQLPSEESFQAFEMAAALHPEDLQMHLLLGRQYMSIGNAQKALYQLRLAIQTDDYHDDAFGSAPVELHLARALEQLGYDQAAVNEYQLVLNRVQHPTSDLFRDVDMSYAVNSPHLIMLQMAGIYERLGQYQNALDLYQALSEADPATFVIQEQVVRVLARMGRQEEAIGRAADIVTLFGATSESLALLHDACYGVSPQREVDVLQNLHEKTPQDRGILFALADAMVAVNHSDDARQLLGDALGQSPKDIQIVGKLFDLDMAAGDSVGAGRLLITQLAQQPDSLGELSPMLTELVRPTGAHSLRPSQIQAIDVPDWAQGAKFNVVAESANAWRRDALERSSIEEAVKASPPFAPAYRRFFAQQLARQDLSREEKVKVGEQLAKQADAGGNGALGAELRALTLAFGGNYAQAAVEIQTAMKLDPNSAELELTYAAVLANEKLTLQCEQALWNAVSQHPQDDATWISLYGFYDQAKRNDEAVKVLAEWLKTNPASPDARVLEAKWSVTQGQQEQFGLGELEELLHDHSDDLQLINKIEAVYIQTNHGTEFVRALLGLRREQPTNLTVVSILTDIFAHTGRPDIALELLNETRKLVASDADMLYEVASLYMEIGQEDTASEVLAQVLQVDPNNAAANNDLAFRWADQGINLPAAEKMIRIAVAAEPDNEAFLDSMGWVLYKQGRFDEAVQYFLEAIGNSPAPDAEIVDHYADTLYRMGKKSDAVEQWRRALSGLSDNTEYDEDVGVLRQELVSKLAAAAAGKPAATAPLGAAAPATQPAHQ
jgi:tetratricopeptide (TPR) repeat protein